MARQPRVEFLGAVYHVMSRGNRGELVFREDGERTLWLETLEEAVVSKLVKKVRESRKGRFQKLKKKMGIPIQ